MPIGDVILGALRAAQTTVGDTVTIRRGSSTTEGVAIVPCPNRTIIEVGDDRETEAEVAEFLIAAVDYKIGGQVVAPQLSDELLRTIGGKVVTFEVLPISDAALFGYNDPHRQTLRIRTKKAAEVDA